MIPKYRAYLKKHERIVDVVEIDYRCNCIIWIDEHKYTEIEDFEDIILLQSTGLKDKNDTEIFEGDILKYWGECRPVVSHEASFGWIEGGDYIPFSMMCISEIGNTEVVGNIYENKEELL